MAPMSAALPTVSHTRSLKRNAHRRGSGTRCSVRSPRGGIVTPRRGRRVAVLACIVGQRGLGVWEESENERRPMAAAYEHYRPMETFVLPLP